MAAKTSFGRAMWNVILSASLIVVSIFLTPHGGVWTILGLLSLGFGIRVFYKTRHQND